MRARQIVGIKKNVETIQGNQRSMNPLCGERHAQLSAIRWIPLRIQRIKYFRYDDKHRKIKEANATVGRHIVRIAAL